MLIGFVGRHDVRCFSVATASPRIEHQGWKIQRGSPCFSIISYPRRKDGRFRFSDVEEAEVGERKDGERNGGVILP